MTKQRRSPYNAGPCRIKSRHRVVVGKQHAYCKWCKVWLGSLDNPEVIKWLKTHPGLIRPGDAYLDQVSYVYSLDCHADAPVQGQFQWSTATPTDKTACSATTTNTNPRPSSSSKQKTPVRWK